MLEWFEARIAAWQSDPSALGLNLSQVSSLQGLIANARAAYNANEAKYIEARSSTSSYYTATDLLRANGAQLIKIVRAFAETQTDPGVVFDLADIPLPQTPQEQGAPPTADKVTAAITTGGNVRIKWSAPTGGFGQGAFFKIERRGQGETLWANIATLAERTYLDEDVPAGFAQLEYRIISGRGKEFSEPTAPISVIAGTVPATAGSVGGETAASGEPAAEAA